MILNYKNICFKIYSLSCPEYNFRKYLKIFIKKFVGHHLITINYNSLMRLKKYQNT